MLPHAAAKIVYGSRFYYSPTTTDPRAVQKQINARTKAKFVGVDVGMSSCPSQVWHGDKISTTPGHLVPHPPPSTPPPQPNKNVCVRLLGVLTVCERGLLARRLSSLQGTYTHRIYIYIHTDMKWVPWSGLVTVQVGAPPPQTPPDDYP
jgi:hypothetical protein